MSTDKIITNAISLITSITITQPSLIGVGLHVLNIATKLLDLCLEKMIVMLQLLTSVFKGLELLLHYDDFVDNHLTFRVLDGWSVIILRGMIWCFLLHCNYYS